MRPFNQKTVIKYIIVGISDPNIYTSKATLTYFTGNDFSDSIDLALKFDTRSAADNFIHDNFKNECMFSYGIEI